MAGGGKAAHVCLAKQGAAAGVGLVGQPLHQLWEELQLNTDREDACKRGVVLYDEHTPAGCALH